MSPEFRDHGGPEHPHGTKKVSQCTCDAIVSGPEACCMHTEGKLKQKAEGYWQHLKIIPFPVDRPDGFICRLYPTAFYFDPAAFILGCF